jgi:predicted RNA methylase
MAKFHFIEDYERLVRRLMWKYPMHEAMSRAVGGGTYEHIGRIEAGIVAYAGLRNGQSLVDLGCGSGRLASALGQLMTIEYCGIAVVKALLRYLEPIA